MDLSNVNPEIMAELENALTAEQIEKIEACESLDEAFALLEDEGMELGDEQLDLVAGGKILGLSNQLLKCGQGIPEYYDTCL